MKNFIVLLSALLFIGTIAMKAPVDDDQKELARVNKVQGIYMFTDCEPLAEYEALGNVKIGFVWDNSMINDIGEIQTQALKRAKKLAKKESIEFDGLIVNAIDDITLIKFKE